MPILELTDQQVVDLVKQLPVGRQRSILRQLAPGVSPPNETPLNADGPTTDQRFRELVRQWKEATQFVSSVTDMVTHPAYQQIIGMGKDVLPLILAELRREPDHWFWALQAIGRIIIGPMMKAVKPRIMFIVCSGLCVASFLVALLASSRVSLVSFTLTGLFTCASFTLIFSGAIQSFEANHGTISGILCTAIIGGAVVGGLVGAVGEAWGMRAGMAINLLALLYVFLLAVWGKGKLSVESP